MKVRTTLRARLYPRLPEFIPRVVRWGHGTRHSRGFAGFLGMACLCALAGLFGCNQYNPYLGATPTVSSSITSITPSGATMPVPQLGIGLTVSGSGFVAGSNVTWNSSGSASVQLQSVVISGTEIQAELPQSLVTTPGTFFVGVIAPGPTSGNNAGNNISNFVPFIVCGSGASGCPSVVTGAESATSARLARLSALIQSGPRYQALVADSADGSDETGGGIAKIFVRDTCLGAAANCAPQIFPVSVGWNGTESNGASSAPSVSADGRFVVFASEANNLVKGDTNGWTDIFLRDTCIGSASTCVPATIRLSLDPGGDEANGPSSSPVISPDGRFVAFNSSATNLVPQLANSLPAGTAPPLFLRDTCFAAASACAPNTSLVISAAAARK